MALISHALHMQVHGLVFPVSSGELGVRFSLLAILYADTWGAIQSYDVIARVRCPLSATLHSISIYIDA